MSWVDMMALGLPFTPIVNWAVFAVCFAAARKRRGIRALVHMRWVALGIALSSTALALIAVSYFGWPFGRFLMDREVIAFLLAAPIYFLTAISVVFLWLTIREEW